MEYLGANKVANTMMQKQSNSVHTTKQAVFLSFHQFKRLQLDQDFEEHGDCVIIRMMPRTQSSCHFKEEITRGGIFFFFFPLFWYCTKYWIALQQRKRGNLVHVILKTEICSVLSFLLLLCLCRLKLYSMRLVHLAEWEAGVQSTAICFHGLLKPFSSSGVGVLQEPLKFQIWFNSISVAKLLTVYTVTHERNQTLLCGPR